MSTCQEVALAGAQCRIDIDRDSTSLDGRGFAATLAVVDPVTSELRPVTFHDGGRVTIHAASEALALSSALTYLEHHFGAPGALTHACTDEIRATAPGPPFPVESERGAG